MKVSHQLLCCVEKGHPDIRFKEIQKLNENSILTDTLEKYRVKKINLGLEIDFFIENGNFIWSKCQRCEGKQLIICTKCKDYVVAKYLVGNTFSLRFDKIGIGIIQCFDCAVCSNMDKDT
ncbi:hypothetical protein BLOT_005253 [Blomia tropicalis]|nr:hypothetical protein BLOT_005253 [Blomia tropicalis]